MFTKIISSNNYLPVEATGVFFDDNSSFVYLNLMNSLISERPTIRGLWNARSEKILLGKNITHQLLAQNNQLLLNKKNLENNWFGFRIKKGSDDFSLVVSPGSMRFGGIPIEYNKKFELLIKSLFSGRFPALFFEQFNYQRKLRPELLRIALLLNDHLVEESLPDHKLLTETIPTIQNSLNNSRLFNKIAVAVYFLNYKFRLFY
ncbi:MAG: hypothetical protein PHV30_03290 [Candidatus Margulisbacteria bacterium]|nr:hypothetical protein [Candidatus Margulisiibacteriota bacterium]